MTTSKILFIGKPFILGICKCPCKDPISVRTKQGLLQRIKHGHNWKIKENNPSKKGAENHNWTGGLIPDKSGYMMRYTPDHPNRNGIGYVREHRLIMEKHLGRYLTKYEVVNHINGIKNDNRLENLEVMINQSKHMEKHPDNNKKDHSKTFCLLCGSKTTYTNDKGWAKWHKYESGYICNRCYDKERWRIYKK